MRRLGDSHCVLVTKSVSQVHRLTYLVQLSIRLPVLKCILCTHYLQSMQGGLRIQKRCRISTNLQPNTGLRGLWTLSNGIDAFHVHWSTRVQCFTHLRHVWADLLTSWIVLKNKAPLLEIYALLGAWSIIQRYFCFLDSFCFAANTALDSFDSHGKTSLSFGAFFVNTSIRMKPPGSGTIWVSDTACSTHKCVDSPGTTRTFCKDRQQHVNIWVTDAGKRDFIPWKMIVSMSVFTKLDTHMSGGGFKGSRCIVSNFSRLCLQCHIVNESKLWMPGGEFRCYLFVQSTPIQPNRWVIDILRPGVLKFNPHRTWIEYIEYFKNADNHNSGSSRGGHPCTDTSLC